MSANEEEIRKSAKELGRRGGLKGGPRRKELLSAERRKEIASWAAECRWNAADEYLEDMEILSREEVL